MISPCTPGIRLIWHPAKCLKRMFSTSSTDSEAIPELPLRILWLFCWKPVISWLCVRNHSWGILWNWPLCFHPLYHKLIRNKAVSPFFQMNNFSAFLFIAASLSQVVICFTLRCTLESSHEILRYLLKCLYLCFFCGLRWPTHYNLLLIE